MSKHDINQEQIIMTNNSNHKRTLILSFIAALAVASISGPQYVYPTFGTSLATHFEWNALENSMVSTATFVAVSFSGPLSAIVIKKAGIKNTLRTSAFIALASYMLLAQTYAGYLSDSYSYVFCSMYLAGVGYAGATSYMISLESQAFNFKNNRGMSMGLTSASLGMSGLIFSQINDRYFKSESHQDDMNTWYFIIFLSVCVAIVSFLGSFILGPIENLDEHQQPQPIITDRVLNGGLSKLHSNYSRYTEDSNDSIRSFSSSSTRYEEDYESIVTCVTDNNNESRPLLSKNMIASVDNVLLIKKHKQTEHGIVTVVGEEDQPINISGYDFFTDTVVMSLALVLFFVLGIGYVYLANIGHLLASISSPELTASEAQHLRNLHVSVFSIANCGSRAVFGTLSDMLQQKRGVHRLWFFWFASVGMVMTLVFLVTSVSNVDELIWCTFSTAVVYGTTFGVAPAIISEYGTEAFARNWGWLLCAPALGSQLFNVVFGSVYHKESIRQGAEGVCYGSGCFATTFFIGALAAAGCVIALSLTIYKKGLYRRQQ